MNSDGTLCVVLVAAVNVTFKESEPFENRKRLLCAVPDVDSPATA